MIFGATICGMTPSPRVGRQLGDWTGDDIRDARGKRGWTQEHLSDMSGVSVGTIQNLESGKTRGQAPIKAKVVAALTAPSDTVKAILAVLQMGLSDAEKLTTIQQLCIAALDQ